LLAAHHGLEASLIGGYHLGFVAGAAIIAGGIALAPVLLGRRRPRTELALAAAPAPDRPVTVLTTSDFEKEAA
jgi:hypothetical protein